MGISRFIWCLVFLFAGFSAIGQKANAPDVPKDVNKLDPNGKRQGTWLITKGGRMGEDGYTEFGNYEHGDKYGKWYKIDDQGDLMAVESYRNNVLDGEVKYYDKGQLTCIGHYRGLNPETKYDTIMVVHPVTGEESLRAVESDRGTTRHGLWQFFDPQTGKLIKEEEYQVDDLVYSRRFDLTKADSLATQAHIKELPHNQGKEY